MYVPLSHIFNRGLNAQIMNGQFTIFQLLINLCQRNRRFELDGK